MLENDRCLTLIESAVGDPLEEHHEHHVQEQQAQEDNLRQELQEDWVAALEETERKDEKMLPVVCVREFKYITSCL